MKYCKKCNRMYKDDESKCLNCNKPLYEIKDSNTPVYLISATGFELDRVMSALGDEGIPCGKLRNAKSVSADAITGFDTSDYYIAVPCSAYKQAVEVCIGIGAIKEDEAEIVDGDLPEFEEEQFEEMPSGKRTAVRIISAIMLIILFGGAIYLTDFIMQLIKGLF